MIRYKRILKEIKNIEEFDNKKKNKIIRGAILTEIFGLYREILKIPFFLMYGVVNTIGIGFRITGELLEIVGIIQFVNKKDYVETIEIIKKNNN